MIARPCDGQPNRMCPSDCAEDCDFNNAALARAMNAPIAPQVAAREDDEANRPWSWIEDLRFWAWFAAFLFSAAAFIGIVVGSIYARFF